MKKNTILTVNEGILKTIKPFTLLRGSTRACMGLAENDKGEKFKIYTASCGLPDCHCCARAKSVKYG